MTSQQDLLYSKLYALEIPKEDIKEEEENEEYERLNKYINDITEWIEVGHLTAFEIEQHIKQDDLDIQTIEPLENKMKEMEKTIENCIELKEEVKMMKYKLKLTKIQSEWSGLQHFIRSLKSIVEEMNEKRKVRGWMESILINVDSLSLMIFQFQEKRHQNIPFENLLVDIDNQVGPLFNDVERVYQRMTNDNIEDDELLRKHMLVQEKWESLRIEIDELKMELKEDRWLAVFKQVADQVEGMMDGLDKTVSQYVHQMRRNTPQSTCSTSSTDSSSSITISSKLKSIEKNFDAKFKYYTPSIDKMLTMLGNGIAARVSKDTITLKRHQAMIQRWDQLKLTMDHLRKREMLYDRPMSPARSSSRLSESSSFKSPEPDFFRARSPLFTPIERSTTPNNTRWRSSPIERSTTPNHLRWRSSPVEKHLSDTSSVDSFIKQRNEEYEERKIQKRTSANQLRSSPVMIRRAVTPSLIPRPKTPHNEIPRPRSSIARKIVEEKKGNGSHFLVNDRKHYKPDMKDELDIEIATMINASPVTIHCQKAPQGQGKYYFGNELTPSLGGGKKVYSCKLMTYRNKKNKVLIRVGGGWQDLEIFLLEHMNLVGN
jgi:hypothetical protein